MCWQSPVSFALVPTADAESFRTMAPGQTGLPVAPHPGAFGVVRKHHIHEGIDLYVPVGTPVSAVETGIVVCVIPFTGPHAGLPWWNDTWAVFVEGPSGVVVYGEIATSVTVGQRVQAGEVLGAVVTVLVRDKGRPTSMLHLELHVSGSRIAPEWKVHSERPSGLLDPTPFLVD